jgi:protein-S-isoprenylcysteine O-methyltransferase Ste14
LPSVETFVPADRIFASIFTVVALLWGLSEVLISMRLRSRGAGSRRDSGTLQIVLIVVYVSVAIAMYIAMRDDGYIARFTPLGVLGLVMILAGMAIRAQAILTLRRFFTVDVTIFDDHRLIRAGPYRYLRHPSYTGALLSFYGLAVGFENPWAALVVAVPPTIAFFIRMQVEEAALRAAFPNEYPEYERATKRLIPFIY